MKEPKWTWFHTAFVIGWLLAGVWLCVNGH